MRADWVAAERAYSEACETARGMVLMAVEYSATPYETAVDMSADYLSRTLADIEERHKVPSHVVVMLRELRARVRD